MGKEARNFSTSKAYAAGDLCLYGGILYRFTTSHSAGAWNSAQVTEEDSNIEQDISRIVAGTENAEKAADYADTVVFSPSNISGTRYKYVLTDAPDPRD